jgi:hypothetical protein
MSLTPTTQTPASASGTQSLRDVQALLGRFSLADQEYQVPFQALTTLASPTSVRTDRIISFFIFRFHGRITVGGTAFTPIPDALRYILQEIRVYGSHSQFGAQTPIKIRAKTMSDVNKIYRISYTPRDRIFKNGSAGVFDGAANAYYDVDVFWTLPLFPLPMGLNLATLYSLKGPDWAGNLFVNTDTADGSAFGTTPGNVTFSSYGSNSGSAQVLCSVIRPLVSVDLMNRISPGIPFKSYLIEDNVVQGSSFTNQAIVQTLNIGKRYCSTTTQSGVLQTGLSGGVRAYASFSDYIVSRQMVSLDGKVLVNPYSGLDEQEFDSWLGNLPLLTGYNASSFIREAGNPDSGFPAETLTAARRFSLYGDVTAANNQGCEVLQDEVLGTPQVLAATSSSS